MSIKIGNISCNDKLREFKQYIDSADRIILSAQFGDGKTFFLQKVREDKEIADEYKIFTLYPVNYQVAQNEDIFEYIKRDLLIQLDKENLLPHVDLGGMIDSIFTLESFKEVFAFLMAFVPGGKVYEKLFNKVLDIGKEYQEKKQTIDRYLESFSISKGCIYEEDAYTKMIRGALKYLREGINVYGGNKKSVLVIEDLDRLDPAHLFRILNVISAHIDDASNPDKVGNKFGVDKIVLVMDYEATRHIYEHFYGKSAPYEGYMSKFISDEPFRYSLRELAISRFKTILSQLVSFSIDFTGFAVLEKRISQFSIRDMHRICSLDYKTRVLEPYIEFHHKHFSTNLPVFKLMVYMAEMGVGESELIECLNTTHYPDKEKWLALMYPVYVANSHTLFTVFSDKSGMDAENYIVNLHEDNGMVVSIDCHKGYIYKNTPMSVEDDLEDHIKNALKVFADCIILSPLKKTP